MMWEGIKDWVDKDDFLKNSLFYYLSIYGQNILSWVLYM